MWNLKAILKKEEKKEELKQVHVTMKKRVSEKALAAKQKSYAYKKEVVEGEAWVDLAISTELVSGVTSPSILGAGSTKLSVHTMTQVSKQTCEMLICEDMKEIKSNIEPERYLSLFGTNQATTAVAAAAAPATERCV